MPPGGGQGGHPLPDHAHAPGGPTMHIRGVEVFTVTDDGLISAVEAYWGEEDVTFSRPHRPGRRSRPSARAVVPAIQV